MLYTPLMYSVMFNTVIRGEDRQENNSKYKIQIFEEYFLNLASAALNFATD
jgi:hypothetical protein